MDGPPVDPESAWSGYAGATRANPSPGAGKCRLWNDRGRSAAANNQSIRLRPWKSSSISRRSCVSTRERTLKDRFFAFSSNR